jgi:autotransporter-associated beta strand protein
MLFSNDRAGLKLPCAHVRARRPARAIALTEPLESRRLLSAAVWIGAPGNDQWSDTANWQGGTLPTPGQDVSFPAYSGNGNTTFVNLSSAVTVGNLSFGQAFILQGASVTVDGNITSSAVLSTIDSTVLGHNTTVTLNFDGQLNLGSVSDGGNHYGITEQTEDDGDLYIAQNSTYTGLTEVASGILHVAGTIASPVQVDSGGAIEGAGTANGITVQSNGSVYLYPGQGAEGVLSSDAGLTLDSGSVVAEFCTGATSASGFGEISVTSGPIDLSGSTLLFDGLAGTIPTGTVIPVISNSTGQPVSGTFEGMPQGAVTTIDGENYQVSYTGGTSGRDVTLTVLRYLPAALTVTSSHVPVYQGQHVTLTATVAAADEATGTPTGTVTFYDDGAEIGSAQTLTNGSASFNDTTLPIGSNSITATYSGDANFASVSTPSALIATVRPTSTSTTPTIVSATASASTHGYTIGATVIGADTGPGGAAGLTYTWTAVHLPSGAKLPTFNVNGTNAASNIIARFSKDGGYVLQCEVKNAAGNAVTADVLVTVSQKPTSLKIEPHAAHVAKDATLQYAGTVLDQFNRPMRTAQTLTYLVASGPGSISSTGLFSATSLAGAVTIEVEADDLTGTVGAIIE